MAAVNPISICLTQQFYAWEERGRGWQAFPFSVDLEPAFHPFFGHVMPNCASVVDDAKRPTLLSMLADVLTGKQDELLPYTEPFPELPPVQACPFVCNDSLVCYRLILPKGQKIEIEGMTQLLTMLSFTQYPVSFEIIATNTVISLQVTVRESDKEHTYDQIKAYYPTALISEYKEGLEILLPYTATCAMDFGLANEFMRPLRMAHELDQDPFIGLFGAMEHISKNERAVIQILFNGAVNPWSESIIRSVTTSDGDSFFADAPEMVKLAQTKVSAPLFGVNIRVAGQGDSIERSITIARKVGMTLVQLTGNESNRLQLLSPHDYPLEDLLDDMYLRETHRVGSILNSNELATFVHFPTPEITSAKLERDTKKTKAVPEIAQGHDFVLGMNMHHGAEQPVTVPAHVRLRHTHIIGATGTGKSTLLLSMIAQDMQLGNGLAVLDPHGDLIESILPYVPAHRMGDVILIDPADAEYPVGFNILSAHSEIEKDILSSDLVAAFKRLSTSWGDQMNSVFANAVLAFLESKEGGTLVDLRRFLVEKPFREAYLKTVSDPHVVYYWHYEYPLLKSSSIGSILTRLDTFLRPKVIRNMVAQKKSLDFESILDSKKILLVKLSQGLIGAENSYLLGTFFVAKMYQAAMARQAKSKADRSDFFCYVDEFQNFVTPSMSYILSGARKYHLGLILAHQDMAQLTKYDTELASSVVVNAGTRICFRLGDADAKRFASGFSYFEAADLENLHTGEVIARIEQPNFDFSLTTIPLPEIDAENAQATTAAVIAISRQIYGTPRHVVESSLAYLETAESEKPQEQVQREPKKEISPKPQSPSVAVDPVELPTPKISTHKQETQHRYLQNLLKKLAESRGYVAKIEEPTPDGKGRVDVSLERAGKRIACEVSVTTGDIWEGHNVEKCLAAGYDTVIVCSKDAKNLTRIKAQLRSALNAEQLTKVFTFVPDEIAQYLDTLALTERSTEKIVRGYTVRTEYTATLEEAAKKEKHIVQAVLEGMRKKK